MRSTFKKLVHLHVQHFIANDVVEIIDVQFQNILALDSHSHEVLQDVKP